MLRISKLLYQTAIKRDNLKRYNLIVVGNHLGV